jgi:hypothetical protein
MLMLLVFYIRWPFYLHRLDEDTESKFRFFKKICVHYKQNYHDITRNTLAALKLLNDPLYDFDEKEDVHTNSIEFEIREEVFTATVKEVNTNQTVLEITIVPDNEIEKFKRKEVSNRRNLVKTLLIKLKSTYVGINLVNRIRRRSRLINQFVNIVLVDLTQENPSGKMPSDQSTGSLKSATMPDGSKHP